MQQLLTIGDKACIITQSDFETAVEYLEKGNFCRRVEFFISVTVILYKTITIGNSGYVSNHTN